MKLVWSTKTTFWEFNIIDDLEGAVNIIVKLFHLFSAIGLLLVED